MYIEKNILIEAEKRKNKLNSYTALSPGADCSWPPLEDNGYPWHSTSISQCSLLIAINFKIKNSNQINSSFHATAVETATKLAMMNDHSVTKLCLISLIYRNITLIHCGTDY